MKNKGINRKAANSAPSRSLRNTNRYGNPPGEIWSAKAAFFQDIANIDEMSARAFRLLLRAVCLAVALEQAWLWRYQLGPDLAAYMDIARAWLRGDWSGALNSYW